MKIYDDIQSVHAEIFKEANGAFPGDKILYLPLDACDANLEEKILALGFTKEQLNKSHVGWAARFPAEYKFVCVVMYIEGDNTCSWGNDK